MSGIRRASFSEWIVPGLVAAVQSVRLIVLAQLPDAKLIGHIPDDAFYYLVVSANFARLGRWTFDGVEPTSGFHLLWAYLLAALYRIDPAIGLHGIFVVTGILQIACMTAAAWLVQRTATRIFGPSTQTGVAIIFLSAISLQMSMAMMETSLAILASAAVLDLLCRTEADTSQLGSAVLLGLAGTLARSDFGLLPLCLFAMQLGLLSKRLTTSRAVKLAGCVLGGATLGLAVIALHTHWISGGWVQASARQKLFWSSVQGFSFAPVIGLLLHFSEVDVFTGTLSGRMDRLVVRGAWLLLVLLAIGLLLAFKRSSTAARIMAGGLVGTILAFVWLYRFDSAAIQGWYIANFEAPVALLAGGATCWFARRWRWATAAATVAACYCGISLSFFAPMAGQLGFYTRGLDLRARPELRPVGAWNAGIVSYFSGGGVVNIDGLMNDRILAHTQDGTLLQYVQQRGLRSLTDFPELLAIPDDQRRGGYSDGALQHCLLQTEVSRERTVLWTLKPECLPK